MAIDEHTRHHLHELARETWDDEAADTLMEMLPPVGWADVATKRDLDALEERIGARFEIVDLRLAAFEERTDARFAAVDHQMQGLRHELIGEMHAMQSRLVMWLVPTILAGVGASAAVARLL
ncbi:MAG: hypothetical protein M5U31_00425 [Acidimicrobiia bacterium]|nr:hypothetical protein [Acidimicrobiia bacterium]